MRPYRRSSSYAEVLASAGRRRTTLDPQQLADTTVEYADPDIDGSDGWVPQSDVDFLANEYYQRELPRRALNTVLNDPNELRPTADGSELEHADAKASLNYYAENRPYLYYNLTTAMACVDPERMPRNSDDQKWAADMVTHWRLHGYAYNQARGTFFSLHPERRSRESSQLNQYPNNGRSTSQHSANSGTGSQQHPNPSYGHGGSHASQRYLHPNSVYDHGQPYQQALPQTAYAGDGYVSPGQGPSAYNSWVGEDGVTYYFQPNSGQGRSPSLNYEELQQEHDGMYRY